MESNFSPARVTTRESGKDDTYGETIISSLYNPFSVKNASPKWPDGLATYSTGMKRQFSSEVYGRDLVIALFPALNNWMQVYQWDENTNRYILLANHGAPSKTHLQINTTNYTFVTNREWNNWRIVGVALRMDCCNSDEDIDGWFECIRTSRDHTRHRMGYTVLQDVTAARPDDYAFDVWRAPFQRTDVHNAQLIPNHNTVQEWHSARNWALSPSYASGKLKDLSKFLFTLNPCTDDNEFIPLRDLSWDDTTSVLQDLPNREVIWPFFNDPPHQYPPVMQPAPYPTDDLRMAIPVVEVQETNANQTFNQLVDFRKSYCSDSWDMILIRTHGIDKTRLSLHTCSNIEVTATEFSETSKYLTNSYPDNDRLERFKNYLSRERRLPFYKLLTDKYWE